jgi:hypothetical protein
VLALGLGAPEKPRKRDGDGVAVDGPRLNVGKDRV